MNNNFSIIISLSLFLITISAGIYKYKLAKFLFIVGIIIYCCLIAFRSNSGSDTFIYQDIYEGNIDYSVFIEPGLIYLFKVGNFLDLSFNYFLIFQAIICFWSLLLMKRLSGYSSIIFYVIFFGLNIDFSTLRQSIALHFLIITTFYIKSFWPSIVFSSIHIGSIFSLFFRTNLKYQIITLGILLVTVSIFFQRYENHLNLYFYRSNNDWIMQTMAIIMYLMLKRYSNISIALIGFFSYFPIGFRLIAFMFPMLTPKYIFGRYDFIAAIMLLIISPVKLSSYSEQSISNDLEKSVVVHYENFFK